MLRQLCGRDSFAEEKKYVSWRLPVNHGQQVESIGKHSRCHHPSFDHANARLDVVHCFFNVDGINLVFGVSATVHAILIVGVFITVATFEIARRKPGYFGSLGRANGGEHE